jgi:hypothetical protein
MGPSWQDDARLSGDFRGEPKLKTLRAADAAVDWDEIAEIIKDAFSMVAPASAVALLDRGSGAPPERRP